MTTINTALTEGIAQLTLALSDAQIARLAHYLTLLNKWNHTYNLTAIHELTRMVSYHVLDSLSLVPYLDGGVRLLDVGSGGGMPGIPVALARPDLAVVLLDANHKKSCFLRQVAIELKLENVNVVTERIEHYRPSVQFDRIVSRAFSRLAKFVKLSKPLLAPDGQIIAMKGTYSDDEISLLPARMAIADIITVKVPGLEADRHLIRIIAP